jgi:hypothetical protein
MRVRARLLLSLVASLGGVGCAHVESKAPPATSSAKADTAFCLADDHSTLEKGATPDALLALDNQFLGAHARARAEECRRLESERLVMRFSFGRLEARFKGAPLLGGPVDVLPAEYHAIKDVSHAVFLAGLIFEDHSTEARARALRAAKAVSAALDQLADPTNASAKRIPPALLPQQQRILGETKSALTAFADGKLDANAQQAFFAKVRPDVLANLRAVSGALVRGLDAAVKRVRAEVAAKDPKAWDDLVVVVTVSHQARAREIGVQYFERLLKEPQSEGARGERRLVVSEGLGKPAQQYGLVSAHIVDQVGSEQVFADPFRIQSDVLADDGGALEAIFPR